MCYIFVIQPVLRRPVESTQFTSWAFGRRLLDAGLVPSMGSIGDCYDNSLVESFWGTMQLELLDSRIWTTRAEIATAIFEWIECWYNPVRRHSSLGMLSQPTTKQSTPRPTTITDPTPSVSGLRGQAQRPPMALSWCAVSELLEAVRAGTARV